MNHNFNSIWPMIVVMAFGVLLGLCLGAIGATP